MTQMDAILTKQHAYRCNTLSSTSASLFLHPMHPPTGGELADHDRSMAGDFLVYRTPATWRLSHHGGGEESTASPLHCAALGVRVTIGLGLYGDVVSCAAKSPGLSCKTASGLPALLWGVINALCQVFRLSISPLRSLSGNAPHGRRCGTRQA